MSSKEQTTAERGREVAASVFRERGIHVDIIKQGNLKFLELRHSQSGQLLHVRVRARTSGTWQGSIHDGEPFSTAPANVFWLFVDLADSAKPEFYVVPNDWLRKDIQSVHRDYLNRHGGQRKISPNAKHHAIQHERIAEWKSRWDLVGL